MNDISKDIGRSTEIVTNPTPEQSQDLTNQILEEITSNTKLRQENLTDIPGSK